MKKYLCVMFVSLCLAGGFAIQAAQTEESSDSKFQWWRESRFGMFVHWGPISIKGTEIGWSRAGERRDRGDRGTEVPAEEYDNLYKQFNPTNFNAVEWVAIARAAGMKYLVFTAKHHDGFCEFDSQLTDYKITRSPFGRDVCAELADACHKAGIRLGFYFSPPDWHDADFFTTNHARYVSYLHGQVREVLTRYAPVDILWFDTDGGTNNPETWDAPNLMKMIHQIQPNILMTKRCGGLGDYDTPEQRIGGFQSEPWETCMTICRQWAWKPDDDMKSLKECIQTLVLCAGGDGNLLFNVGPMPDGRIEPRQVERLKEMGAWLARNGESVYGTRGGPWKPTRSVASTRKGSTVYLHILSLADSLVLNSLPRAIKSVSMLDGGAVKFNAEGGKLRLDFEKASQNEIDTVVRIELEGSAMDIAPLAAFAAPDVKGSNQ